MEKLVNEARLIYQLLARTCKGQTQSFHGNHSTVICNCQVQQLTLSKTSPRSHVVNILYLWFDQEEEREDEEEEAWRRFRRYNIIVYNEGKEACLGLSVDSF